MWSGVVRRSFAHLCFILNENCSQLCEMAANAPPLRLRCPWKCYVSSRYRPFRRISSVAGVDAPAFVERALHPSVTAMAQRVSPGLMPRPSLSVPRAPSGRLQPRRVSPGLMPRPSLSAGAASRSRDRAGRCVAGVDAPAFVERAPSTIRPTATQTCVAGVDAPAFVERGRRFPVA